MPPVDESHQIVLSAFGALRPTRTKDGKLHALDNGGEHLPGRSVGVTLTAAYVDHHRMPFSPMLAA
jgi:hypothetical protein